MDHVVVRGAARARGRQYGQQAASRIGRAIACYRDLFARRVGLRWEEAVRHALGFVGDIEAHVPEALLEMHGIAEGAGVPFESILVLNCRSELMFAAGSRRPEAAPAECTAFAVTGQATGNGHTLVGQNWDWVPFARDLAVRVEALRDDGPSYLTIVEAGMLAKVGFNAAGLGLCTNTLVSRDDAGRRGVPYHVMLRALLDVGSVSEAQQRLTATPRALSANFLVAHRSGDAANFETTGGGADGVRVLRPEAGRLAHANHFLDAGFAANDAYVGLGPHSVTRLAAMRRGLDAAPRVGVEDLMTLLRDHDHAPNGICSHSDPLADPLYARCTVASIVIDATVGDAWFTDGPPCAGTYRAMRLGDGPASA